MLQEIWAIARDTHEAAYRKIGWRVWVWYIIMAFLLLIAFSGIVPALLGLGIAMWKQGKVKG